MSRKKEILGYLSSIGMKKTREMVKTTSILSPDDFGKIKKCAIFVHYSINDSKRIEEKKNKLIKFCEDKLQVNDYEIFIEIGSFLEKEKYLIIC